MGEFTENLVTEDCVLATIDIPTLCDKPQPCNTLCDDPTGTVQQMVGPSIRHLGGGGKTLHTDFPRLLEKYGHLIQNQKVLEKFGFKVQNYSQNILEKRGGGTGDGGTTPPTKPTTPPTKPTITTDCRLATPAPVIPTLSPDPRTSSGGKPTSCSGGMPPDPRKSSGGKPTSLTTDVNNDYAYAYDVDEEELSPNFETTVEEDSEDRGSNTRRKKGSGLAGKIISSLMFSANALGSAAHQTWTQAVSLQSTRLR
jgi:hypothetical protein